MEQKELDAWLEMVLPKHRILTNAVVSVVESLLARNGIDYLTVSGRTKDIESIKEKIKRKTYRHPDTQLTDLSGIRIIAYFESDVEKISTLIEGAFNVDRENSLSKDLLLATDQIGYRSIHFVCDLGESRAALPEFDGLSGLKFEFQIRTVLQHAWAELAHDRKYKFSGKLPKEIERKLYLYAGMLEIADKGFDELSQQIDGYIEDITSRTNTGDFDIEINSISLEEYVGKWSENNKFPLERYSLKSDIGELVQELNGMGVRKISELMEIIPSDYAEVAERLDYSTNIYGLVRDWMLIHDYQRYHDVPHGWSGFEADSLNIIANIIGSEQMADFQETFSDHDFDF